MESLVIHIGYHKSASTFLQQQIFPLLPVNYIFLSGENREILDNIESESNLDPEKIRSWITQEISRKYPTGKHEVTILSHEELSGHPQGYKSISPFTTAKNLKGTFPDAKILIIVRNQLDYLTSIYTFRVAIKGYETRDFSSFLREEGEKGLIAHLEYHHLIEYYRDLFGKEKVTVLPMELLSTSAEEFYNKVFLFMNLPNQAIPNVLPVNVSTKSRTILDFWRPLNYLFGLLLALLKFLLGSNPGNFPRVRGSYYDLKRSVTGALNRWLPGSQELNIKEVKEYPRFIRRFEESNRRLQSSLDTDLAKLGYPVRPA